MEMTLNQIITLKPALESLLSRRLKARVQYYLIRNLEAVDKEVSSYVKVRRDIGEKYGEVNQEEGIFEFPDDESREAFFSEVDELGQSTVDISVVPINLDWLEDIYISGKDMAGLSPIIEE